MKNGITEPENHGIKAYHVFSHSFTTSMIKTSEKSAQPFIKNPNFKKVE